MFLKFFFLSLSQLKYCHIIIEELNFPAHSYLAYRKTALFGAARSFQVMIDFSRPPRPLHVSFGIGCHLPQCIH